ncbi:MAG: hypothetical protein OEZ06_04575 [Myxococcales bacterium]|nr:hypothetical protein [Myxococcales bacterium]
MLVQRVALHSAPSYAVVEESAIAGVLRQLSGDDLRQKLNVAFRQMERQQPALADFVSDELSEIPGAPIQAMAYFLYVMVYLSFEASCGRGLHVIGKAEIEAALSRLVLDGQMRSETCGEASFSEDAIASSQPALMRLINQELDRAAAESHDVDRLLEGLLVLVLALTESVTPTC